MNETNTNKAAGGAPVGSMPLLAIPCPFCGGTDISVREGSTFRWRIAACDDCGATCGEVRRQTLGNGTNEEWDRQAEHDAVACWNTRKKPSLIEQAISELSEPNGSAHILRANILMHWSRSKIETFAKHLLGDEYQPNAGGEA